MTWRLIEADCIEAMQQMDESSVDAIVTDPPYGLEFMGKEWDRLGDDAVSKSWDTRGRRDNVPSRSPDDAGGRHGVHYKRQNPRCRKCGRAIQGRDTAKGFKVCGCTNPEPYLPGVFPQRMQAWHHAWATEALRVLKPGGHLLAFGGTRTYHRLACAIEDAGFEIRDCLAWMYGSGFPKSLDVSKAIDKAAGVERVLTRAGEVKRGGLGEDWDMNGSADRPRYDAPATPDAEQWQGWGTALKPAFEPIVLARKPLVGTVAANVLEHGTGALNVDGCRIEGVAETPGTTPISTGERGSMAGDLPRQDYEPHTAGRWPANVVLDEAWIPVIRRRYNLSHDAATVLDGWLAYVGCRDVPTMRGRNRRAAEPSEADEVLLQGVLRPLVVGEPARDGAPDDGAQAHTGVAGEDERDTAGSSQAWVGQPDVEGVIHEPGLRDDLAAGSQGDPRASAGDGGGDRSTVATVGDRPPHQRDQARQPAGEPRAADEPGAPRDARGDIPRVATATGAGREVLLWDVPSEWLTLFEFTGDVARVGAAALLDEQTGTLVSGPESDRGHRRNADCEARRNAYGGFQGQEVTGVLYGDSGGASRFFYVAKSASAERNRGLEHREAAEVLIGAEGHAINPMTGKAVVDKPRQNTHPTVKPVELMQWLCRLVTPPGGVVLDPFTGSGSTGIAALREGFSFIGIEREAEYVEIARDRIIGDAPLFNVSTEVT